MTRDILILLVEDDVLIQGLLDDAMTEAGFATVVASTGTEALAELAAGAGRFRAVLTDIRLGQGPDGWAVARRARALRPAMPVLYMSGDSGADWAAKGVPGSIMVPKPFVDAQILAALTSLMTVAGRANEDLRG